MPCRVRLVSAAMGVIAAIVLMGASVGAAAPGAQVEEQAVRTANHSLASQWTPQKIEKLVFDTEVEPHWLEHGNQFWYAYETPAGKRYVIVDPEKRTKGPLFDHVVMAAALTRITRVPVDAQHLGIKRLRFVKDDAAIQIEVEVPKDAVIPGLTIEAEEEEGQDQSGVARVPEEEEAKDKKSIWVEYDRSAGQTALLGDFEGPPEKMRWASVSPDDATVVFARGENLYMMDASSYALAQEDPADTGAVEVQLTTDGEAHFGYARRLNDEDRRELKKHSKGDEHEAGPRVPPIDVSWSQDSKKFAVVRRDMRKGTDLWVINSLSKPRPTLETYRYAMPGEKAIPQPAIEIFDVAARSRVIVKAQRFVDQSLAITEAPTRAVDREKEKTEPRWTAAGSDRKSVV